MVDEKEIAGIEGFDEDTARELQTRARDYLGKMEAELDAKRQELGVEDALKEVPGVTTAMLVDARRGRHQDRRRISPAAPPTICSAGASARTARPRAIPAFLDGFELSRDDDRGADHAGARQGRLDQGGRPGAAAAPKRRRPRPVEAATGVRT